MIPAIPLLLALAAPAPQPAPAAAPAVPPPVAPRAPAAAKAAQASAVPTQIEADVIRYNWTTRKVVVTGKPFVTLRRGDMVLICRTLQGDNDEKGQLRQATCDGEVKLVRATRVVTCDRAHYDRDAARVICEGSPLLRDGETEVRGKRLTYFLDADEVVLEEAVQAVVPSEQIDQGARKGQRPPPGAARPPAGAPAMGPAPKAPGGAK